MKSKIEMSEAYKESFNQYLSTHNVTNGIYPTKFWKIMKTHRGYINYAERLNDDYIELRNPLIVVLGDSVSGGHFEMRSKDPLDVVQNLEECYVEVFKHMLHDYYGVSTLNIINSSIAGDNIYGMYKRLEQDVLMYKPDLVILNGSLNYSKRLGDSESFGRWLHMVIEKIMQNGSELVLMSANMMVDDDDYLARVNCVREAAKLYALPFVDIYKIYEDVVGKEHLKEVLSNGVNHPTPYGHVIMAKALMQLFDGGKR